ncbi:MAG: N-acetylmuramoyl-L-alanine amidase [Bacilli bacterium]
MKNFNIEKRPCKNFGSRGIHKPIMWCLHTADGFYEGTIQTFLKGDLSAHFVIGKDGEIAQLVDIDKMAYTQGITAEQSKKSKSKIVREKGINPNLYCLSVEFEGFYNDFKRSNGEVVKGNKGKITDRQVDAFVWLFKSLNNKYNISVDRDHIIGHYEINHWGRPCCPGELFPFDQIISKLKEDSDPLPKKIYKVQVGAFSDKANAEGLSKELTSKGYGNFVVEC